MKRFLMAATAAVLLATPALAQSSSNSTTATTDNSQAAIQQASQVRDAQDFINMAAMSDMFEIQTGEMAEKQSGNKAVKQLGKHLVKDHSQSSKQLMKIAKQAKIDVAPPAQLDQRHQVIVDSLKDAKGEGFDTAFAQAQVQAHEEGIALFKAYSENGDNDQLKAFAKKGLPTLQKHLEMAQKLAGPAAQTQ